MPTRFSNYFPAPRIRQRNPSPDASLGAISCPRDRNLLLGVEGGAEAGCPETAPRAGLRPPMPHESILNRPVLGPPRAGCGPPDGCVLDFLDFCPIVA